MADPSQPPLPLLPQAAQHLCLGAARVRLPVLLLGLLVLLLAAPARPATGLPAMQVWVDATDLERRIFRVQQSLAVKPGALRLQFPRWLPGQHAPTGEVGRLAGLEIRAADEAGQPQGDVLAWQRDPLDTHGFTLAVPAGVGRLHLAFMHLSPTQPASGRVVVTPQMLNLQWQAVVLAPAGRPVAGVEVAPALRLPAGWQLGTALQATGPGPDADGWRRFRPVSLDQLVDSPVFAGRHFRRIPLEPEGAPRPVVLNLVADEPLALKASEAQIEAHRQLVVQADRLFASRHFGQYDFLLALTDELGSIGLEHHESSENSAAPGYFSDPWDKAIGARELLPHEYAHSWNGKFRRPAGLATTDFTQPMQNALLWLYEGQTEFWGKVLAVRSGLVTPALFHDSLADIAAQQDGRAGRRWRSLQDTTQDNLVSLRRGPRDWRDFQRSSQEYYLEGVLIWLDADMLIRERSGGARSLDDFARAFFGVADGQRGPMTYGFDDVVAALQAVQPHDWAGFLRRRLDSLDDRAPLDGLSRAGWRLAWADKPSEGFKAREARRKQTDLAHSLGLVVAPDGQLRQVRWDSPAFQAGLAPGMVLVAVQNRVYKPERLKAAIVANRDGSAPLQLLVRDGELFRSVDIDWRGGLRYPTLERIDGRGDRLAQLLAPR